MWGEGRARIHVAMRRYALVCYLSASVLFAVFSAACALFDLTLRFIVPVSCALLARISGQQLWHWLWY